MRDLYQRLNQWEELYEAQRRLLANPLSPSEQEVEHRKLVGFKYEFGRSLLEAGDMERAKKIFRGVIKLDKDFIPAYLGLGEVYFEEGKSKEAAELWEKAYKMTSSILLLHRLEDLYLQAGRTGQGHRNLQSGPGLETPGHTAQVFSRKALLPARDGR